jgi:hypothetical protein
MAYWCEDKNGKYLGSTYSQREAQERILRANIRAMEEEGVDYRLIALYEWEQRKRNKEKLERDYQKQKKAFYIFLCFVIFALLSSIFA